MVRFSMKKSINVWGLLSSIILWLGCGAMLLPFIWMVLSSFKTEAEITIFPPTLIPAAPTLMHYIKIFSEIPMGIFYFNSLYIALLKTVLMVFTSAALGYVFAKFAFKGREFLFAITLSTMMLPFPLIMIPLYIE